MVACRGPEYPPAPTELKVPTSEQLQRRTARPGLAHPLSLADAQITAADPQLAPDAIRIPISLPGCATRSERFVEGGNIWIQDPGQDQWLVEERFGALHDAKAAQIAS